MNALHAPMADPATAFEQKGISMSTIQRFHVTHRLSDMTVYNNTAYLAGQVPEDGTKDIKGQTREVLEMIDRLLAEAGTDKSKILSTMIYLADLDDFAAMNEVWDAWVAPGNAPPRATVQAKLAKPEWRIEVVVTAAVP